MMDFPSEIQDYVALFSVLYNGTVPGECEWPIT